MPLTPDDDLDWGRSLLMFQNEGGNSVLRWQQ
jgi:hypothetical protein